MSSVFGGSWGRVVTALLALVFVGVMVTDADAARRKRGASSGSEARSGGMSESGRYAAYVVDAKTGRVLFARNAEAARYPASLTKMMTLYILFEELDRGRVTLSTPLEVSAFASAQSPSKLGLRPGDTIQVADAIRALVTKSANDVAVVVAENIAGSQDAFAARMTRTARRIGMADTTFRNASGLPNPGQVSSAKDMVTLGLALQERFPEYYRFFATRAFAWGRAVHANHNKLLGRVEGIDGIKTGYTQASGFNLVSSIRRDGRHVVAAVMGGPTGRARDAHMANLLATHLPMASRGPKSQLVSDRDPDDNAPPQRMTLAAAAPVELPRAPAPAERPSVERGAAVAMAKAILLPDSDARPSAPMPIVPPGGMAMPQMSTGPIPPAPIGRASAPKAFGPVPPAGIPGPRPAEPKVSALAGAPATRRIDTVVTHSIARAEETADRAPEPAKDEGPKESGWMIQLAAVDREDAARALLDRAKGQAGRVLNGHAPVTEMVTKGSSTLYRARFAGFADQNEANAACATLKRKDFSCLAIRQ